MPNFPWPGRQDASAIEDATLEAMLSGPDVPEDLAAGLQPASDVLAALRARPSGDELAGEVFAMAEFRNRVGVPDPVRRTRPRRRPALLTSLVSAKVAVAAAAIAITLGGVATAAFADVLPAPVQRLAHAAIDAPPAHSASHPSGSGAHAGRTGGRRPFRHHPRRHGCWTLKFHPSSMTSPHPSWTPTAHPTGTPKPYKSFMPKPRPTCTPAPRPSGTPGPHPSLTPKPHRSFMPGKFRHHRRHHHHRYPVQGPSPTGSPAPRPTSSPSPMPSSQG